MNGLRQSFATLLLGAATLGLVTLFAPAAFAKGKPGGGIPPNCPCQRVISPSPGVTCTLTWCAELVPGGFECGYTCTF